MTDYAYDAFHMARSERFTARLQYLLGQYAKYVVTATALPAAREASKHLAARIQSDPGGMTSKIAVSLASDAGVRGTVTGTAPALDSTLTDDQLDAVIQAVWNSGAWDNVL